MVSYDQAISFWTFLDFATQDVSPFIIPVQEWKNRPKDAPQIAAGDMSCDEATVCLNDDGGDDGAAIG